MDNTCPVCGSEIAQSDAICASCGFNLHGSTQEFSPIRLDEETSIPAAPASESKPAGFTVLRGPQVGIRIGLADSEGQLSIGRSPNCEVFLNDKTVSRRHALLERTPAGYQITDLNSFNGIWVNNKNVTSTILRDGDIIQIGAFCLRVDC